MKYGPPTPCACPYSQVDGACGESSDNPAQVQGFEGDQDHAHICCQLFVALRINKVVSGLAPNIRFVASSGGTVHSAARKQELRQERN